MLDRDVGAVEDELDSRVDEGSYLAIGVARHRPALARLANDSIAERLAGEHGKERSSLKGRNLSGTSCQDARLLVRRQDVRFGQGDSDEKK